MWPGCGQTPFSLLDSHITFQIHHEDGTDVDPNTEVATLTGPAHVLLTGERVALNLLGRLSAIATLTQLCVQKVAPWGRVLLTPEKQRRASVVSRNGRSAQVEELITASVLMMLS